MKLLLTIITVVLPIIGLLHYIYYHDKIEPGPVRMLYLIFLAGIAGDERRERLWEGSFNIKRLWVE